MGEWLKWICGSLCVAAAVLQIAGVVWVLFELRRKWRTVPELWSRDWLDIVCRVERAFGVTLLATDFEEWSVEARVDMTAGQLWELIRDKIQAKGAEAPADGWERIVTLLSDALNIRRSRIVVESRLYADLNMMYGPVD